MTPIDQQVVPIVRAEVRRQPLNFLGHAGGAQAAVELPRPEDAEEQELSDAQHDQEHAEIEQASLQVKREFVEVKHELHAQQPRPVRLPVPPPKRLRRKAIHAYLQHGDPGTFQDQSD